MKQRNARIMFLAVLATFQFFAITTNAAPSPFSRTHLLPTPSITCPNKLSGGERSECKVGLVEPPESEIQIKIASTNPSVLRLDVSEVTVSAKQSFVKINIATSPTPIKTTVVITASLAGNLLGQTSETIEVVPALIASAQLSASSFVGTHGAKTTCQVRLRAPAPPGGIQLYLSPLKVSPGLATYKYDPVVTIQVPTPTVPHGSDNVNFDIPYDNFFQGTRRISEFDIAASGATFEFDAQTRTVELIVALEPQGARQTWVPIAGIANKLTFEVVPLRVTSLSIQPSTLNGSEGLATMTLSAAAGNAEEVYLRPIKVGTSKLWTAPLGVSCAAAPANVSADTNKVQLAQGSSTYQFKVCSATVSTILTLNVSVFLRSGSANAPVTLQP